MLRIFTENPLLCAVPQVFMARGIHRDFGMVTVSLTIFVGGGGVGRVRTGTGVLQRHKRKDNIRKVCEVM